MSRTRRRVTRAAAVSAALVGALSLSACQEDSTVSAPPTSAASSSVSSSESTSAAPTTSESSTTESQSPSSSSTTEATESSSSASSAASAPAGDTKVTPNGTTLKMGQPGVVNGGTESSPELLRITPKKLEVAPSSVYKEENLNEANGKIYYLTFDVTNLASAGSDSVNGLFFHPKIGKDVKGAKRMYGSSDACKSESSSVKAGESATNCYMYQIPGAEVTDVEYNSYSTQVTWTK